MTEEEYCKQFENFLTREGLTNLTRSNGENDEEFSTWPCDVCRSHLSGYRHHATGYHMESSTVFEYSICVDCAMFAANGDLPDYVH